MVGIQDLKILASDYGLTELFDEYSNKCGIYDDNAKDQAMKLRNYRSQLDILEKRFIQAAGSHYNM